MACSDFPLDIYSAKKYGIEKWRKDFFWPVSYESFLQVETEIRQELNELIEENSGNYKSDLLIINYKIFIEYSNMLNALRVLKELNKKGLKAIYGESSILYKGIMEKGIPTKRLMATPVIPRVNVREKLRSKARLIKWTILLNRSWVSLFKALFSQTSFVANYSSLSESAREYIRSHPDKSILLKDTHNWYPKSMNSKLNANQEEELMDLAEGIIRRVEKTAHNWDLTLTKQQRLYLFNSTFELFRETMICLNGLKKYLASLKPVHLLSGSVGQHFVRMFSAAVRSSGGTVTWFKHAEPMIYLSDHYSWVKLSSVDRFITYTQHSARAMETMLKKYPPLKNNNVRIEGAETRMFYDLWRKESKRPLSKKIKSVMLVAKGFQNDNKTGQGIAFPALMQLDWELRIINILKRAGYKVLYKVHPHGDQSEQARGLFGNDVEVVYEPFEEVMNLADAFLFYHTITTTSGQALSTNKPIIYINGGWEKWVPEVFESFSKRCFIVSAQFDERNRLMINEKELICALGRKPSEPDTEFIERYMLPDSLKA